jgi:site-specific DNA recombinase
MLDAVYIDAKQYKTIVDIKPKLPFIPIFQVAVSNKDSPIRILNEPLKGLFRVAGGDGETRSPARTMPSLALFLQNRQME